MLYSLARFRHAQPSPPFALGGEFLRLDGRRYLKDAFGVVEFTGPEGDFENGDLVVVEVGAVAPRLTAVSVRLEFRSQRARATVPRPQALRFPPFVARVREFLIARGLSEVYTPTLVTCPGLEPSLEAFATRATFGSKERTLYLPTSPEVHLKKAMAQGLLDIFEIKSTFRRGEFSNHHAGEFAMLEWYRGFADLTLIQEDLIALIRALHADGWIDGEEPTVRETDFAALFQEHFAFTLTPQTSADQVRDLCRKQGVETHPTDTFDDLFHRLMIDRLEAKMAQAGPLIVRRFPPSQAALAKLDQLGWADRFEFYWQGLEIANAFNEVNDPQEQARRWTGEQAERARLGTENLPQDPELIRALECGIPSAGGIALGMERLFMACTGVREIRDLRHFSLRDLFVV